MRYLIVLALLAGCASQPQPTPEEQARAYTEGVNAQCRSYGFTPGTADFRDCVMRIDMANRQAFEAQRQMLLQQYLGR